MKRCLYLGMLIFSTLGLVNCANDLYPRTDLTHEKWPAQVVVTPTGWERGADRWFQTADPFVRDSTNPNLRDPRAIRTMQVPVKDICQLRVNGNFHVQLFSTEGPTTLFLHGPAGALKAIQVQQSKGGVLTLAQSSDAPAATKRVIIRIGVHCLTRIEQLGDGLIEAAGLNGKRLKVHVAPTGCGNIYLTGNLDLAEIVHEGQRGKVTIFNTETPDLVIKTTGGGSVNLNGRIGVRSIFHSGENDINIVGADTSSLRIYADGGGKIGVQGVMDLKEVVAKDNTCVDAYYVTSAHVVASSYDNARIGLAGKTRELRVDACDNSSFEGRYLRAYDAYVRAGGAAHVNVMATHNIFAAASGTSSIYYFGSDHHLSKFVSGSATIVPIGFDGCPTCHY